eukprot:1017683-Rhodomonas_salina.1
MCGAGIAYAGIHAAYVPYWHSVCWYTCAVLTQAAPCAVLAQHAPPPAVPASRMAWLSAMRCELCGTETAAP